MQLIGGLVAGFFLFLVLGLLALVVIGLFRAKEDEEPLEIEQHLFIRNRLDVIDPMLSRPLTEKEVYTAASNNKRVKERWLALEQHEMEQRWTTPQAAQGQHQHNGQCHKEETPPYADMVARNAVPEKFSE